MLIDAKKIWISGGYGLHHNFEHSLKYIRQYATGKNINPTITETILSEIFIELAQDEKKYIYTDFICPCGCEIDKSATALIHEVIFRIDNQADEIEKRINMELTNNLNQQIIAYMIKNDEDYLKVNSVFKETWFDKYTPTFKKWLT